MLALVSITLFTSVSAYGWSNNVQRQCYQFNCGGVCTNPNVLQFSQGTCDRTDDDDCQYNCCGDCHLCSDVPCESVCIQNNQYSYVFTHQYGECCEHPTDSAYQCAKFPCAQNENGVFQPTHKEHLLYAINNCRNAVGVEDVGGYEDWTGVNCKVDGCARYDPQGVHISDWDTSQVTDMSSVFEYRFSFNQDLSRWNIAQVTDMTKMFYQARRFNNGGQPLTWDVSTGQNIDNMFFATGFNQNIESWNVDACVISLWGKYYYTDEGNCVACGPGLFADNNHAPEECNTCTPGRFIDDQGVCQDCPVGQYHRVGGAPECKDCMEGTYNDEVGQSTCKYCSAGKYNNARGSTDSSACQDCEAGSWANKPGRDECKGCSAGKWSATAGLSADNQCTNCVAGKWSDQIGQDSESTCQDCAVGLTSIVGTSAADDCSSCSIGKFRPEGADNCVDCGAGTYADEPGAVVCKGCSAGKSSAATGQDSESTCQDCGAGTYADQPGAVVCKDCSAGKWSDETGLTADIKCTECSAGKWSDETGLTADTQCAGRCPAGTWSDQRGLTAGAQCAGRCSAGKWSATEGLSADNQCDFCSAGKWSDETGLTADAQCIKCVAGKFSASPGADSNTCAQCASPLTSGWGYAECVDLTNYVDVTNSVDLINHVNLSAYVLKSGACGYCSSDRSCPDVTQEYQQMGCCTGC